MIWKLALDSKRKLFALIILLVFLLSFTVSPFSGSPLQMKTLASLFSNDSHLFDRFIESFGDQNTLIYLREFLRDVLGTDYLNTGLTFVG